MGILQLIQGAYYVVAGANILSHLAPHAKARAIPGSANGRRTTKKTYGFTAFDYGLYNTTQDVPSRWTTNLGLAFEFNRLVNASTQRPRGEERPHDFVPADKPLTVRLGFGLRDLAQPGIPDFAAPEITLEFTPDFQSLPLAIMFDKNQSSIRPMPGSAPLSVDLFDAIGDTTPDPHTVAPGAPVFYLPFEPPTTNLTNAYSHNFHISVTVVVLEPSVEAFCMWFNPPDPSDVSVGWIGHNKQIYQAINYDAA